MLFRSTWKSVDRATSYRVYLNGVLVGYGSPTTGNTLRVPDLVANTAYAFTVSGTNVRGEGPQSAATTVSHVVDLPATPTDLTATAKVRALDLAWTPVDGALGYRVWVNGVLAATTTSPRATLTGLTGGRSYDVTVAAYNAGGQSPQSSPVTAVPLAAPDAEPSELLAPTGLRVTARDGALDVTWAASTGATGTRVRVNGVLTTQTTGTSVTLTGLTNGTAYQVTVAAYNATGESPESSPVSGTPSAAPQENAGELPATPASVAVTARDGALQVAWVHGEGATGARVRVDGNLAAITTAEVATVTGLTNGRTYRVTVAAYNAAGESAPSAPVSATPAAAGGDPEIGRAHV